MVHTRQMARFFALPLLSSAIGCALPGGQSAGVADTPITIEGNADEFTSARPRLLSWLDEPTAAIIDGDALEDGAAIVPTAFNMPDAGRGFGMPRGPMRRGMGMPYGPPMNRGGQPWGPPQVPNTMMGQTPPGGYPLLPLPPPNPQSGTASQTIPFRLPNGAPVPNFIPPDEGRFGGKAYNLSGGEIQEVPATAEFVLPDGTPSRGVEQAGFNSPAGSVSGPPIANPGMMGPMMMPQPGAMPMSSMPPSGMTYEMPPGSFIMGLEGMPDGMPMMTPHAPSHKPKPKKSKNSKSHGSKSKSKKSKSDDGIAAKLNPMNYLSEENDGPSRWNDMSSQELDAIARKFEEQGHRGAAADVYAQIQKNGRAERSEMLARQAAMPQPRGAMPTPGPMQPNVGAPGQNMAFAMRGPANGPAGPSANPPAANEQQIVQAGHQATAGPVLNPQTAGLGSPDAVQALFQPAQGPPQTTGGIQQASMSHGHEVVYEGGGVMHADGCCSTGHCTCGGDCHCHDACCEDADCCDKLRWWLEEQNYEFREHNLKQSRCLHHETYYPQTKPYQLPNYGHHETRWRRWPGMCFGYGDPAGLIYPTPATTMPTLAPAPVDSALPPLPAPATEGTTPPPAPPAAEDEGPPPSAPTTPSEVTPMLGSAPAVLTLDQMDAAQFQKPEIVE
jgi:hypothetical protein